MVNKCIIQGRLVNDPDYKITKSDKPLCNFTIVWGERIGKFSTSLFLECIAWSKNADMVAKHFVKGQEIIVVGKLFTNKWTNKSGRNSYVNKLTVEDVQFCGVKIGTIDDLEEIENIDDGFTDVSGQEDEPVF